MATTGVKFEAAALRATERDINGATGETVLRNRRFSINLTPVIEVGQTVRFPATGPIVSSHRSPDTLNGFEIELVDKRFLWRRDKDLWGVLSEGCSLEFWTREILDRVPVGWIHWLYPNTTWGKAGWGRYVGVTSYGEPMKCDDIPDKAPIEIGGFWKTPTPPPVAL